MKAILGVSVLAVLVTMLGVQIYFSLGSERELQGEYELLQAKLLTASEESEKLRAELEYFRNPANLEKELKARFNYKREGENLIIIIPPQATSTE